MPRAGKNSPLHIRKKFPAKFIHIIHTLRIQKYSLTGTAQQLPCGHYMLSQSRQLLILTLITGDIYKSKLMPPFNESGSWRRASAHSSHRRIPSPYHNTISHFFQPPHGRQVPGRGVKDINVIRQSGFQTDKTQNNIHGQSSIIARKL